MKMYEVGGCVRDEILGIPSKDIDFSVVLDEGEGVNIDPYQFMVTALGAMGVQIIRNKQTNVPVGAEFVTARGIAPKNFPVHPGRALDFVLARKESGYADGRRPDKVEPGTLEDDLARRDFTMNAIAKDSDGTLIDPFGGQADIENKIIRCVGDPLERFTEDALRAVRALRFSVTKGFVIESHRYNEKTNVISPYSHTVKSAMEAPEVLNAIENKISDDRIRGELEKMFRFDSVASIWALQESPALTEAMFAGDVSLDATMKTKGRG